MGGMSGNNHGDAEVMTPEHGDVAAILHAMPEPVLTMDAEGAILTFNSAAEKMLGYLCGEVSGKHIAMLVPELRVQDHVTGANDAAYEVQALHKSGEQIAVNVTINALPGASAMRFVGVMRNMQPLHVEHYGGLREKQRLLEMAEDIAQFGHWRVNIKNNTAFWSDQTFKIHGLKPSDEQIPVDVAIEFYHPDDRADVMKVVKLSIEEKRSFHFEKRIIRSDGEERVVESWGEPQLDEQGDVLGVVGTFQDVTERYARAKELEESHELLESFFGLTLDLLAIVTVDGEFVKVNQAWKTALGYEMNEIQGHYYADFVHPDDEEITVESMKKILNGEILENFINRYAHKGGGYRSIEWRVSPAEGGLIYCAARDVTERQEIELQMQEYAENLEWQTFELERAREDAEKANQLKSEFLANMSHEIRTPMNGVVGMTNLLLGTALDGEQKDYAKKVATSADYLMELLNDILDFSKIEAGKMELENIPFDIQYVVREVADISLVRAAEKGIKVETHIANDVPKSVVGDPSRLRQILYNLVSNAIKFTSEGSVLLRLNAKTEGDKVFCEIEIEDTGVGISEKDQASIFSQFIQADSSTSRKFGGTGLGLSICKELTNMMNGDIGVRSVEGEGSVFWFQVTLGVNDLVDATATPELMQGDVIDAMLKGRQILLAEDNNINQQIAKAMLESYGCVVTMVADGKEAVDIVKQRRFDVILMDCQMPEMDGYEATEAIRVFEKGAHAVPHIIIALTANAMKGDAQRCMDVGMDAYVSKPVKKADLAAKITTILQASAEFCKNA